jgi:hypothetical protein
MRVFFLFQLNEVEMYLREIHICLLGEKHEIKKCFKHKIVVSKSRRLWFSTPIWRPPERFASF